MYILLDNVVWRLNGEEVRTPHSAACSTYNTKRETSHSGIQYEKRETSHSGIQHKGERQYSTVMSCTHPRHPQASAALVAEYAWRKWQQFDAYTFPQPLPLRELLEIAYAEAGATEASLGKPVAEAIEEVVALLGSKANLLRDYWRISIEVRPYCMRMRRRVCVWSMCRRAT